MICRRCGGRMWREHDTRAGGYWDCLRCGHVCWLTLPDFTEPTREPPRITAQDSRTREIIRLQYRQRMNRRREVAT